jgi:GMP synthase-like glutamine amidotransferase
MNVHVLQHVPFEGLGSIAPWLARRNARVTSTRFFEPADLPPLDDIDFVIVLGGPMSANDEADLEWMREEKHFIANALAGERAVLGICLGAQLVASVAGSRVYRNVEKEIGWFPIFGETPTPGCFALPPRAQVFHWHGETFDLPHGAVHLAHSAACRNQAFQLGRRTLALQFHLETTRESAEALVRHCASELVPARYIQTSAQLRVAAERQYAEVDTLMSEALDYLVGDIAGSETRTAS